MSRKPGLSGCLVLQRNGGPRDHRAVVRPSLAYRSAACCDEVVGFRVDDLVIVRLAAILILLTNDLYQTLMAALVIVSNQCSDFARHQVRELTVVLRFVNTILLPGSERSDIVDLSGQASQR
jgi:hypothetical protein